MHRWVDDGWRKNHTHKHRFGNTTRSFWEDRNSPGTGHKSAFYIFRVRNCIVLLKSFFCFIEYICGKLSKCRTIK